MKRSLYSALLHRFLAESNSEILGKIASNDKFGIDSAQKSAWIEQIIILKEELRNFKSGKIIFEYVIPRIGKRIDNVFIHNDTVYLLEFKVGEKNYLNHNIDQVMDYALDLKYFHSESHNVKLVPVLIATEANAINNSLQKYDDNIYVPICCNKRNIYSCLNNISSLDKESKIVAEDWENSIYKPTPTIIEAAQALYSGHNVEEISRSDAGAINFNQTTEIINNIIDYSKSNKKKSICFITGVPGAGKTLAGLNIASVRQNFDENEHAVFLSGNGPLVDVLQESLARDQCLTSKVKKTDALRKAKSFIQIIHHFRDEALKSEHPPTEKVTIFDEAQRAWTKEQTSKFMRTKKGQLDFDMSEPEFLIQYMNRHEDWAVIICLVGGGQEINTGEAGLGEWFQALKYKHKDWNVFVSNRITDNEYRRGKDLNAMLSAINANIKEELHLSVSLRSFRSENLSGFVKSLLDVKHVVAKELFNTLKDNYDIVITRDLIVAKNWIKNKARGTERYGMVASSKALRLKAEGIYVKNDIEAKNWFLNDCLDVRSSYYLEDTATEFDIQGLELDFALVAWGADFRFNGEKFIYKQFRGNKWININSNDKKLYLKNAYRVLLTRARQGMVIYVPYGDDNDHTRICEYYNGIYEYMKEIGIEEINKYEENI